MRSRAGRGSTAEEDALLALDQLGSYYAGPPRHWSDPEHRYVLRRYARGAAEPDVTLPVPGDHLARPTALGPGPTVAVPDPYHGVLRVWRWPRVELGIEPEVIELDGYDTRTPTNVTEIAGLRLSIVERVIEDGQNSLLWDHELNRPAARLLEWGEVSQFLWTIDPSRERLAAVGWDFVRIWDLRTHRKVGEVQFDADEEGGDLLACAGWNDVPKPVLRLGSTVPPGSLDRAIKPALPWEFVTFLPSKSSQNGSPNLEQIMLLESS